MLKQVFLHLADFLVVVSLVTMLVAAGPAFADQLPEPANGVADAGATLAARESPEQEPPPVVTRLYPLSHVSLSSAYTLATAACRENDARQGRGCNVEVLEDEGTLVVTAVQSIHERVATLLSEVDKPPLTQTFQIIVLAATDSPSTPSSLPRGAQQALEDIQSFLPYEGFRVLDTGWLKTVRFGQTTLTGPTGFEVALEFRGDPSSGEPLLVAAFEMWIDDEVYTVDREYQLVRRSVVETSFSMDVGETVVVGTSKLNGNSEATALVILLTAVAPEVER
jgi:hypothetical protein